jgi:hypothetical protein
MPWAVKVFTTFWFAMIGIFALRVGSRGHLGVGSCSRQRLGDEPPQPH